MKNKMLLLLLLIVAVIATQFVSAQHSNMNETQKITNAIDINNEPAIKEILGSAKQMETLTKEQKNNLAYLENYVSPCDEIISLMQKKNYSISQIGATLNKYGYDWVPGDGDQACWKGGRIPTEDEIKVIHQIRGPDYHPFGNSNAPVLSCNNFESSEGLPLDAGGRYRQILRLPDMAKIWGDGYWSIWNSYPFNDNPYWQAADTRC